MIDFNGTLNNESGYECSAHIEGRRVGDEMFKPLTKRHILGVLL